jgi:hypothetical protein
VALISLSAALLVPASTALGAPANDDFANAVPVGPTLPFSTSIDERGATSGADDPTCLGHDATAWFSFTPTSDVKIEASTAGSDYSTALSVWTGSRGSLQYIACSNPFDGHNAPVTFRATAGVTYYLMVGTFGGGPGTLSLSLKVPPPPPPPPTQGTFLYLASDRGDYIGIGKTLTLTPDDVAFEASIADGFFRAFATSPAFGGEWWIVDIAAPPGEDLKPGTYANATRASFRDPGEPGLDVYGDGRGCNTVTGRFTVNELLLTGTGDIRRFDADFEQHCGGYNPALIGKIRIENGPLDQEPPVLSLPQDLTVEATSAAGAAVSYNATATDETDPQPSVSCTPPSGSTFPLGTTVVTCTATDSSGNQGTGSFRIRVVDTTRPSVSCGPSKSTLWPPNNKFVPIAVTVAVRDAGSGPAGFRLVSAMSNEFAPADLRGFVLGTPDTTGELRAARAGNGGRVYTLTYVGTDNAGNTAECRARVTVPHDNGR